MLNREDRDIAQEFQRRLSGIVPLLDLSVFGSRARGEASPESDLDVFIELENVTPALRQSIDDVAWEVGFEMNRIISTFVVTRDQLEHGPIGASPLIAAIQAEGVRP